MPKGDWCGSRGKFSAVFWGQTQHAVHTGCGSRVSAHRQNCPSECVPLYHKRYWTDGLHHPKGDDFNCFGLTVSATHFNLSSLYIFLCVQGTMIIPNLSSVLSEEGQWKFPHDFNPSNFLNEQGQFEKPEAFIPFSAGESSGVKGHCKLHSNLVNPNQRLIHFNLAKRQF